MTKQPMPSVIRMVTETTTLTASRKDAEDVGQAVRAARKACGLSQQELADRMREMGHHWYQPLVGRIERGTRDLRWSEGKSLNTLIGLDSDTSSAGISRVIRDAHTYQRIVALINDAEANQ